MINHYAILGVHPMLTNEQIRSEYRLRARQHHPDRPGGDPTKFAEVTRSYAAIGTERQRQELRALYALTAPACALCSSSGVEQKTKGFTAVEYKPCPGCGGCGYLLDQAATLKSYTGKRKRT